ncbi:MAG: AarF/UbiB family protein, partial [Actinomycetota bacterium]|nr:AarF/UbiB family protein [Actinomycetota bacterium]
MSARGRRIAGVALRRGFLGVWHARLGLTSRARRRAAFARQARFACEELGPAFIKLGQLASVRPDIFSAEMVFELERLQDSVPPVPVEDIERVIAVEFGYSVAELFDSFDPVPLASASIAQVHRAQLASECRTTCGETVPAGGEVVVKVVRPGIARIAEEDLALARALAQRLSRFGFARRIDLVALLDEFATSLRSEMDLRNEGRVADRFAFDLRDDPRVVIPKIIWPRTTRRVLTMEYVQGWRLTELTDADRAGIDAFELAVHGAEVFMRQVLSIGRFHADLHPANLFVTPDSRICYLDFGIVGRTEPAQRIAIAQVLAATVYGDADRAVRYSRDLGLDIPPEREAEVREHVARLMDRTLRGP